ncbi:MAG TPA: hypothetical protein PK413_19740, partial [Thermoanaerobaculia bacterium]|nr:hypothetical protein [Thermoanaerobaculia bacterium]
MGRHLSREKLQGLLLREQVSREELRDLLDHLFEACPECGELASDLRSTPAAGTHPLVERALCRGEERRLQMIRWQAVARAELAELLELPPAR